MIQFFPVAFMSRDPVPPNQSWLVNLDRTPLIWILMFHIFCFFQNFHVMWPASLHLFTVILDIAIFLHPSHLVPFNPSLSLFFVCPQIVEQKVKPWGVFWVRAREHAENIHDVCSLALATFVSVKRKIQENHCSMEIIFLQDYLFYEQDLRKVSKKYPSQLPKVCHQNACSHELIWTYMNSADRFQ